VLVTNDKVAGVFTMAADISDDTGGQTATATFAGGYFWCMEPPFDAEPGVLNTILGYTGGSVENPTYEVERFLIPLPFTPSSPRRRRYEPEAAGGGEIIILSKSFLPLVKDPPLAWTGVGSPC